jgi:hypothetical protein
MRMLLVVALAVIAAPNAAWACSATKIRGAEELVREADAIVRVRAAGYAKAPPGDDRYGPPSGVVGFDVLETLAGVGLPASVQLSGTLTGQDDFNDREPPYAFVRRAGRRGNCYAFEYRKGAEFLLFLKKAPAGYTVDWAPLAAVNEQLHSDQDPWLLWTRKAARRRTPPAPREK